jgi:hypothetical protein
MSNNQWLVLMLFVRSSASTRARLPPREATTTLFWRMLVSRQAPPEQRHRRRECFGNSLLLSRKVSLPSSVKWMNWRGRQKRLKGSLRNTRNGNRRSTTIFVSYAHALALLLTLSLQLPRLDAVNICGLMCGLIWRFDVCTRIPVWCGDTLSVVHC